MLEAAIEAGADDVESDASGHVVTCAFEDLGAVSGALEAKLGEAGVRQGAVAAEQTTTVDEEKAASVLKLIAGARGRRRRAERLLQLRGVRRRAGQADGGLS